MPAGWSYYMVEKQYGAAYSNVGKITGPEGIVVESPLDHEKRVGIKRRAVFGEAIAIRHEHHGGYEGVAPEYKILMPSRGTPVDDENSYENMLRRHNAMFADDSASEQTTNKDL